MHNGQQLFKSLRCVECHQPPHFTSSLVKDVGLQDERGHRLFNPPSLRGASHRRRFFHDGRATSLPEVVQRVRHQLSRPLTAEEENHLIAYLESL
ncbi:MAG: cytochrome c peroxidase [Rubripirellula sp.]